MLRKPAADVRFDILPFFSLKCSAICRKSPKKRTSATFSRRSLLPLLKNGLRCRKSNEGERVGNEPSTFPKISTIREVDKISDLSFR